MEGKVSHINPAQIKDDVSRQILVEVLNELERSYAIIESLKEEVRQLKDEVNRLKGEQAVPRFPSKDKSEEKDRKDKGKRNKNNKQGSSKSKIEIDRTKICKVDKSTLPSDAQFKGYQELISQDIKIERVNTLYKVETYYSPSQRKTYRGHLPSNYQGQFGKGIHLWVNLLHHVCDVTHSRLKILLDSMGIQISAGSLVNMLLSGKDWVLTEQLEIQRAGITHSTYTQIDSTKSMERGQKKATQIICGAFFKVFHTMADKSRQQVLAALLGNPEQGLKLTLNEQALRLLKDFDVSEADRFILQELLEENHTYPLGEFEKLMTQQAPHVKAKKIIYRRIVDSLALAYYHSQNDFPIVNCLLSDDAVEYRKIAGVMHALCWIHDARHYKKLCPKIQIHQNIVEQHISQYWDYYGLLLSYKQAPCKNKKRLLEEKFDILFGKTTDYFQLNERKEKSLSNKDKLLAVLDNPALPLHNNDSELGARRIVRKRDISLHSWSTTGTRVRDGFMSIVETALKLGISPFEYIADRIRGEYRLPDLASCVANAYG